MHAITVRSKPRELNAETAADAAAIVNDELAAHVTIPPASADAVRELVGEMLAADIDAWLAIDPYQALLVHRALLEAQDASAVRNDPDARDRLRLALEALASALYSIAESEPTAESRSGKEIVRWLVDTIDVPQKDIASLLGIDLRKLQRWLSDATANRPEGDDARRVRTVAKIANQLRHGLTAPGVIAWFEWPSPELGGATPESLLAEPDQTPALLRAASNIRATTLT